MGSSSSKKSGTAPPVDPPKSSTTSTVAPTDSTEAPTEVKEKERQQASIVTTPATVSTQPSPSQTSESPGIPPTSPPKPPQLENPLVDEDWNLVNSKLDDLEQRINWATNRINVQRVQKDLHRRKVVIFRMKQVPANYYSLTLDGRREILGASSVSQLCKTIVLENILWDERDATGPLDATNPRYLAVVVQYEAKINTEALARELYNNLKAEGKQISRKKFKFQLAPDSVSETLTGFIHNAVTPFGMRSKVPIVVCQGVLDCKESFIWLGGGEVDMKLGLTLHDLMRSTGAISLSCSNSRAVGDDED